MKLFLSLLCLSCLTSCLIGVEDFGKYWDEGTIDKNILGRWSGEDGSRLAMFDNGGTYKICTGGNAKIEDCRGSGRVLKTEKYHFIMTKKNGEKGGYLYRYQLNGNTLAIIIPPDEAHVRVFLKKKHPEWEHLVTGRNPSVKFRKEGYDKSIKIMALDDEVLEMLYQLVEYCNTGGSNKFCGESKAYGHKNKFIFLRGQGQTQPETIQQQEALPKERMTLKQRYIDDMNNAVIKEKQILMECGDKFAEGEIKSYLGTYRCSHDKIISLFNNAHYIFMDVLKDVEDKRFAVYTKGDKNKIPMKTVSRLIDDIIIDKTSRLSNLESKDIVARNPNLTQCQYPDMPPDVSMDYCVIQEPISSIGEDLPVYY